MKKNDEIILDITQNASVTKSIAHYEGEKVIIEGGYAGQRVLARVVKYRHSRAEAVIEKVIEEAPNQCEPKCPDFGLCGGCSLQDLTYSAQLALKEEYIRNLFKKAGILAQTIDPITPSPICEGYRNKMEYSFGDETLGGELSLGMHKKKSHYSVIGLKDCTISPRDFNIIRLFTQDYFRKKNILAYNRRTAQGSLRHLVLRHSVRSKMLLVNIVTTGADSFDEKEFVNGLLALELNSKITGILHTINSSPADAVIPQSVRLLYGQDMIRESICGLTFQISPFSFFQTNTLACEKLYELAMDYAGDISDKTVFDLYCGTGTISQIAARKAKKVVAIELVAEAVESAKKNAELNAITNCSFITGDVLSEVEKLSEKPELIILDPPRAGIGAKALKKIIEFSPETFVYISCKAQSLVAELPEFIRAGYQVKRMGAVDMFPYTAHVETIVLLSKTT